LFTSPILHPLKRHGKRSSPHFHGEHYYLTQDEWNAMAARFNVSGIPHYLLVDKKGTVVRDHSMLTSSVPELKRLIEQYLN